jgi:hypothetical protein
MRLEYPGGPQKKIQRANITDSSHRSLVTHAHNPSESATGFAMLETLWGGLCICVCENAPAVVVESSLPLYRSQMSKVSV